ncbi:PorT family protein, partial [candidate division KSB1 bacterium]|nr:PorT family protein [candidate division KSB1 bacterium]
MGRKSLAIAIVFIFLFVSLSGAHPLRFGVKGGMNLSTLKVDPQPSERVDALHNWVGGGFVDYPLFERFKIEGDLMVFSKGALLDNRTMQFRYFSIPLMLKAYFGRGDLVPFLGVGPQVDFLVEASYGTDDRKSQTASRDLALNLGGGVEFKIEYPGMGKWSPFGIFE